jgi:hypothetical protein
MKPDPDKFFEVSAVHLMTRTGPALGAGYEQSSVGVLAGMLLEVRVEFDRAAARRVEENQALRRLFADSLGVVSDAALRTRLEQAAAGSDASLAVSDLEGRNAELRALLIDLHCHVEGLDGAEARRLEESIWRELVASTERRRLPMGPF